MAAKIKNVITMKYLHKPTTVDAFRFFGKVINFDIPGFEPYPEWFDELVLNGKVIYHSNPSSVEVYISNKPIGSPNLQMVAGQYLIKDEYDNLIVLNEIVFEQQYSIIKNEQTKRTIKNRILDWLGKW